MNTALIFWFIFMLVIFATASIATKKFIVGLMVLLILLIIGNVLTILPSVSIIIAVIGLAIVIAYYLFMRSENRYGF